MARGYVKTRLGQIHYIEAGEGDLLLFIHQAGRSSRMFRNAVALLGAYFHSVAIDLPGFGNSDPAPDGITIDELGDLCAEVVEALGATAAHVYGHHSGNKIAAALAVRHPDRVRRLVLAGQSHSIIPDQRSRNAAIYKFTKPYQDVASAANPEIMQAERWALVYRTIATNWWRPGVLSGAHKGAETRARDIVLDALEGYDGAAKLYNANLAYDLGAAYRAIPVRTLVLEIVTPEEDRAIGRKGQEVCALIPDAELATIEHEEEDGVTLEDRAEELADIIVPFLRR